MKELDEITKWLKDINETLRLILTEIKNANDLAEENDYESSA